MSDQQSVENLDLDLQRRIRMSHLAVLVILCLASIWLVLLLIFDDKFGALISGTVALVYLGCLMLFQIGLQRLGRTVCLFSASLSTFAGMIFWRENIDVDLLFLPVIAHSFLAFLPFLAFVLFFEFFLFCGVGCCFRPGEDGPF